MATWTIPKAQTALTIVPPSGPELANYADAITWNSATSEVSWAYDRTMGGAGVALVWDPALAPADYDPAGVSAITFTATYAVTAVGDDTGRFWAFQALNSGIGVVPSAGGLWTGYAAGGTAMEKSPEVAAGGTFTSYITVIPANVPTADWDALVTALTSDLSGVVFLLTGEHAANMSSDGPMLVHITDWTVAIEYTPSGPVAPTVDLVADATQVGEGDFVTFTETHTGTEPVTLDWAFPGGTPATASGPGPHDVTYATAGTYVARLDATNVAGSSFDEVSIEVVGAVAPVAAMLIRPEDATVGQGRYATFTARSTGTRPVTHEWVFAGGDPATATGFGPHAVQFWDLGPHDVSITTTNAVGQDTDTQVLTVVEAGAKVWNGSAWGGAMMADAAGVYHPMRVWVDGVWVDVQPIDLPGG